MKTSLLILFVMLLSVLSFTAQAQTTLTDRLAAKNQISASFQNGQTTASEPEVSSPDFLNSSLPEVDNITSFDVQNLRREKLNAVMESMTTNLETLNASAANSDGTNDRLNQQINKLLASILEVQHMLDDIGN